MGKENLGSGLDYIIPGRTYEPAGTKSNRVTSYVTNDSGLDYHYKSPDGLRSKPRKLKPISRGGSLGY